MKTKRGMQSEDLLTAQWLADVHLSPDGKQIAYVQSCTSPEGGYESQLWLLPVNEPFALRKITSVGSYNASPRWSPDSKQIVFVSNRTGINQIWLLNLGGGEAQQMTHMRHGAFNPQWSPDGGSLAFCAELEPEDLGKKRFQVLTSAERNAAEQQKQERGLVIDSIRYRSNGTGYLESKNVQIFVMKLDAEPIQITEGPFDHRQPAWSPNGDRLAFVANRSFSADFKISFQDLYVVTLPEGRLLKLTETDGVTDQPAWSPDGSQIAYFGNKREYGGATYLRLWLAAANGAEKPLCLTRKFDQQLGYQGCSDMRFGVSRSGIEWNKRGTALYFLSAQAGAVNLYELKLRSRTVDCLVSGKRQIFGYSFAADRNTAALLSGTALDINQISLFDLRSLKETCLTESNQNWLHQVELSEPEEFWLQTKDGHALQAWLIKPLQFDKSRKYPVILQIHGGPHAMYGYSFSHEFQLLAALGYAVLYTNPRGSHGYGQKFACGCLGDYGGQDYLDLMTMLDEALQKYDFLDAARLGVTGGSYGGFMTNWIISHTDRFLAAVSQRSISNWVSFFGVSDIGYTFTEDELLANPITNMKKCIKHSPINYVQNIHTPLLILHSEQDYRCPIEQGEQLFTSLKMLGREVRMVRFSGASHELSRSGSPSLRLERLNHMKSWFQKYIPR